LQFSGFAMLDPKNVQSMLGEQQVSENDKRIALVNTIVMEHFSCLPQLEMGHLRNVNNGARLETGQQQKTKPKT
jgi:hypothetical protein